MKWRASIAARSIGDSKRVIAKGRSRRAMTDRDRFRDEHEAAKVDARREANGEPPESCYVGTSSGFGVCDRCGHMDVCLWWEIDDGEGDVLCMACWKLRHGA
jgi:hypothetical protein